jgi:hypothetical protein
LEGLKYSRAVLPDPVSLSLAQTYSAGAALAQAQVLIADVLANQTALPEPAVKVLVEGLAAFDVEQREQALKIIGAQSDLAPSARKSLENVLARQEPELRITAANLLLAADPRHPAALGAARRDSAQRFEAASVHQIGYATGLLDIWRHASVPRRHVVAAAWRLYDELVERKPGNLSRETFKRMLSRLARYTDSPRRMIKVLSDAFYDFDWLVPPSDAFVDSMLREPEAMRQRDFKFKRKILPAIRRAVRESLGAGESNILGVLIVGSLNQHPTPKSDIDLLFVTRDGGNAGVSDFSRQLFAALGRAGFSNRADKFGVVRYGSLGFKRELGLGARFLGREAENN